MSFLALVTMYSHYGIFTELFPHQTTSPPRHVSGPIHPPVIRSSKVSDSQWGLNKYLKRTRACPRKMECVLAQERRQSWRGRGSSEEAKVRRTRGIRDSARSRVDVNRSGREHRALRKENQ